LSRLGDYHIEMPSSPLDDDAVEAFLSGRPTSAGELAPLAAFAEDLRVTVERAVPVPTADLATLLTDGIPAPSGAEAGAPPERGPQGVDPRNRRRFVSVSELLAVVAARLAGLGMAAKAALGMGLAAASVSGAGIAGILPDPVHHAVATVVSAATPFELSDSGAAGTHGPGADDAAGVPDDDADADVADADRADNHGACVSEVAQIAPRGPNGEHGQAVSRAARSDCGEDSSRSTTTSSTSTSSTTSSTLDDTSSVNDDRGRGRPGSSGGGGNPGNGNPGNGSSGNSGSGNSGSGGGQGSPQIGKSG